MPGFSTLEVLIALLFLSTMLIAASLLTLEAPLVLEGAREHHEALARAEAAIMREEAHPFEEMDSHSTATDGFAIELFTALLPDEATKRLTAQVAWEGAGGRRRSTVLTTYVTNYQHPGTYSCDILPRGDWSRLQRTEERLPLARIDDTAATRTALAVSSASTLVGNALSFFLYTVADGMLIYQFSLATSSTTAAVSDMALTKTHAYIASASTCAITSRCGQLKIIDLTSKRIVGHLLLSRTTPPYAGTLSTPVAAKSIAYRDGYVYLGLEQTPTALGQEFTIIDVRDAANPQWVGGYRVGRTVNDIVVWRDRAYLATNARASADILILDVSNPTHIEEVASIALPILQTTSTFGYAHVLELYENELHVGRSYISNADEWMIVDETSTPLLVTASHNRGTPLAPASIRSIILRERQALLVTSRAAEVWDRTDPFQAVMRSSQPLTGEVSEAVCIGNELYIASYDAGGALLTRITSL